MAARQPMDPKELEELRKRCPFVLDKYGEPMGPDHPDEKEAMEKRRAQYDHDEKNRRLHLEAPKKVVYFGLCTPVALPIQCLLEMGNFDYEGQSVALDEWPALKPKAPTGVLPYAEMPGGRILSESGAIGRVVAGASGNLGVGWEFETSEMLVGMTADFNKKLMELGCTIMNVDKFGDDKKRAYIDGKDALIAEWTPKYVKFLESSETFKKYGQPEGEFGDRFSRTGTTFGEVDLFAKLHCHINGAFPELATGELKNFYERMKKEPGIKKVLDGKSKFGKLAPYLIPVPPLAPAEVRELLDP